ncbi:hypothetical protein [Spiroplasma endosymbiont of Nebria brevicollis]|uniref:hypothetical protein n=1 Tax=Spiroplasma endosymbiont of Nebria brevicollis TaxID=3066284 RepID=UPI00313CA50B
MEKLQFLQNKTFIKWIKYNCITIVIGVSVILNIIYLPKYFNGQNNNNQDVTTITIEAIDSADKTLGKTILTRTTYVTTFKTLGSLLNACTNQFEVKKYDSMNLRYLYGVTSDSNLNVEQDDNDWWQVEEAVDGKHFVPTPMGIDDTLLTNNDHFQFELTPINSTK